MSLENLFKHKVPLHLGSNDEDREEPYVRNIGYHYHSDLIEDGRKVGINNPGDLYDKLTPFIRYAVSTMKHELSESFYSTFNIYLQCMDETDNENFCELIKMVHFELNSNFMFENILSFQSLSRYDEKLFKTLFSLYMEVYCYFRPEVGILNESFTFESDVEESNVEIEEQPKPIEEYFKIDQCVICMEKEPCILFLKCKHVCVCLSCETIFSMSLL